MPMEGNFFDSSPPKYFAEIPRSSRSLFKKCIVLLFLGIPSKLKEWIIMHKSWEILIALGLGLSFALYFWFWSAVYFWLVFLGFLLGYVVCAPDVAPDLIYSIHKQVHSELLSPHHCAACKEEAKKGGRLLEKSVRLNLPNPLHDTVSRLLQMVIRDFVDDWYLELNTFTRERKFQSSIFNLLKSIINNFLSTFKTRIPSDISATLTSSFCILTQRHVSQYKKYARLCSKGEFLKAKDILSLSHAKEREYLSRISELIFCHLIPSQEKGSEIATLFIKDLIGNVLVFQLVDFISAPSFINGLIVDFLDLERDRLYLKTKKGYCLLRIKLLKARNLAISCPKTSHSDYLHVTFLMCNKKLKSKKKKAAVNVEFGEEEFRFKIPDSIAKHDLDNSVVVSLKETNIFKVNEYIGTCEFFPLLMNQNEVIRGWHSLSDGATGNVVGELELEYSIIKFPEGTCEEFPTSQESFDSIASSAAAAAGQMNEESFASAAAEDFPASSPLEDECLNLGHVINNHEFFLEFFNFLSSQKAQSFMHLWVSIDSFLKNASLASHDIDVQSECKIIFNSHFDPNFASPDYLIPTDNAPLQEFYRQIVADAHQNSPLSHEQCIEVLRQTQDYLYVLLEEFYFPLFRTCDHYRQLQAKYYKEQHEAFLGHEKTLLNQQQPTKMHSNTSNFVAKSSSASAPQKGEFNFIGCKLDCRLISPESSTSASSSSSSNSKDSSHSIQHSSTISHNSEHLLNSLLFPVNALIGSVIGGKSSGNNLLFNIEISLKYPVQVADLAISSYSITRSHSDLHQMHRALKKQFSHVIASLTFPSKKSIGNNQEKKRQLEYQIKVYLETLISHEMLCETEALRSVLIPNSQETARLFGSPPSTITAIDGASKGEKKKNSSFLRRIFSNSSSTSATSLKPPHSLESSHSTSVKIPNLQITKAPNDSSNQDYSPLPASKLTPLSEEDDDASSIHSIESSCSSDHHVDVFLDSIFSLLTEVFDISGRGQWIKRQILNAVKHLFKQTRTGSVKSLIDTEIVSRFSPAHLNCYLLDLERLVWPQGILKELSLPTQEEQEALAAQAKAILLKIVPDPLATVIGRGKVLISLSRLHLMLQYREYNKLLIYEMLLEACEVLLVPPVPPVQGSE